MNNLTNLSKPNINVLNAAGYTNFEQVSGAVDELTAHVRINTGVANNCAYIVLSNALDDVRKHNKYKREVKRAFNAVTDAWKHYEAMLQNSASRFFDINDLNDEQRKAFGDITSVQFFDFWRGYGYAAYKHTYNAINSLRHKFRKIAIRLGYDDPDIVSSLSVAHVCLDAACQIYDLTLEIQCDKLKLDRRICNDLLYVFSPKRVLKAFQNAITLLYPNLFGEDVSDEEQHNIDLSYQEITMLWTSTDFVFRSISEACEEYSEIFRTKGYAKKAAMEAASMLK